VRAGERDRSWLTRARLGGGSGPAAIPGAAAGRAGAHVLLHRRQAHGLAANPRAAHGPQHAGHGCAPFAIRGLICARRARSSSSGLTGCFSTTTCRRGRAPSSRRDHFARGPRTGDDRERRWHEQRAGHHALARAKARPCTLSAALIVLAERTATATVYVMPSASPRRAGGGIYRAAGLTTALQWAVHDRSNMLRGCLATALDQPAPEFFPVRPPARCVCVRVV
jgi:hypothetical protein